jgi:hypothetical protein
MKTYRVKIKGLSPMLHHGSQAVGMEEESKKKKGGSALLGDPEEWKKTIYFNKEVGVYLPAINLEASLIEGAKQFKIGRGTASKYFKSGVFINQYELPMLINGTYIKDLEEVEIDKRTVKNPSTKGRNCRYRAIFRNWECEIEIMINADDYIDSQMLKEVFVYTGSFVGVCDFRPRFGRFEVTDFQEINT